MEFTFIISKSHPSLAGHFPENPLVPGVVILEEVLRNVTKAYDNIKVKGFPSVKFLLPLKPEQKVNLIFRKNKNLINFECLIDSNIIASGSLKVDGL